MAVPVVAVIVTVVAVLAALRDLQLHGRVLVDLRALAGLDGQDLAGGLVARDFLDGDVQAESLELCLGVITADADDGGIST